MEKHVTSFNDIIRSRLENLYEENELEDFIFNIFDSLNRKDSYAYPAAYASFSIIFLDAYKELNSKVLDGSASLAEIELFSLLKDASSLEEIMDLYESNVVLIISVYVNRCEKYCVLILIRNEDTNGQVGTWRCVYIL